MGQEHDAPVLAVDIGGTKLAAALVDPEGRITHYDRIATPADPDPRVLWRTLESLLDKLLAEAGCPQPAGVGVGCGGPMRWPSGEVS